MRILILSPFLPSPGASHAGGVVLWRMVQGLATHHELALISFVSDEEEQRQSRALLEQCSFVQTIFCKNTSTVSDFGGQIGQRVRSLVFSRLPYEIWRFRSRAMTDAVTRALTGTPFDIVQVEFTQLGQYVNAIQGHPCTIFRGHDLAYRIRWRRVQTTRGILPKLYQYIQWRRMRRYELAAYRRFHKVIVPSDQIKAELLAQSPELDISVVPFGITLPSVPTSIESPDNKRILFVGAMGRSVNVEAVVEFYQKTWPRIQAEEPNAEFWIVGSNPPPRICRLAQIHSNVKVTGFVDDLMPFYAQASVFVAPLLAGGGVVTKILDAMAMCKAVVTTSAGNEGIGATPERELLIADEPDAFAKRVVELLREPVRRQQIGQNGRRFVQAHYSWESIVARLERVYTEVTGGRAE